MSQLVGTTSRNPRMAQGGEVTAGVREGGEGGGNGGERGDLLKLVLEENQQGRTIQVEVAVWIASQALHGLRKHLQTQTDRGLLVRTSSTLPGARVGSGEHATPASIAAVASTIMNTMIGRR